jgi:hypothetical protein
MTRAYEEIVEFIASGTTPAAVAGFEPSDEAKRQVADLLHKEKTAGLKLEHLMRLAKARARTICSND